MSVEKYLIYFNSSATVTFVEFCVDLYKDKFK